MAGEVHVDDIGVRFEYELKFEEDVSLDSASLIQLTYVRPDDSQLIVEADLEDGLVVYTTKLGDLLMSGIWNVQVYIEIDIGGKFHSDILSFIVYPNL